VRESAGSAKPLLVYESLKSAQHSLQHPEITPQAMLLLVFASLIVCRMIAHYGKPSVVTDGMLLPNFDSACG
jgi:hypothetical protein